MSANAKSEKMTAKVFFKGLMLMCISKENDNRLEVGFVQCPGHEPKMRIEIQGPGGQTIEFNSRITSDLYIWAVNPKTSGITIPERGGDMGFFPHHPDLEDQKYFHKKVTVNTSVLSTRISVNAGELYTERVLPEKHDVVTWTDPAKAGEPQKPPKHFDKLSEITGLDIKCEGAGSGIAIFDRVTHDKSWLPALDSVRYQITIDSDCRQAASPQPGSDFRLYYTSRAILAKDRRDLKKFDFERDGRSPRICERAFLSKTDTLGLPVVTYEELNRQGEEARREGELEKTSS